MRELEIYIDGASKGNPGPSDIGVVVKENGRPVKNLSRFIGRATNNVAEYSALIAGLEEALIRKAEVLAIKTDSELLYRQIKKIYRVRNPNISGLYEQALNLLAAFPRASIEHVRRENNKEADRLATLAIKQQMEKQRI